MLKQIVTKMILFTGLMMGLFGVTGVPAWATIDPLWSGNVRQAVSSNRAVKEGLQAYSEDCNGLDKLKGFLRLGADLSAVQTSGELGELRMHLVNLELVASKMQMAAESASNPELRSMYATVMGLRNEAFALLEQKLAFCGNGVERESTR